MTMPKNYEYTKTQLKRLYLEANPGASESKARREAEKEYKRRNAEAKPHLILDIHSLKDPTCGEAEFNLRTAANRAAAAQRLGVAV